jgi:hypothetical protein
MPHHAGYAHDNSQQSLFCSSYRFATSARLAAIELTSSLTNKTWMPMTMIYSKTLRFLCTAAVVAGFSTLARAQASRTWVSGVGDDANPCSRTAPCLTFAGAILSTAAGGEINVLDPGGFGTVTITKAISIISDNVEAGVLVSSGANGIVVNVGSTDQVVLDGLDM